MTAIQLIAAERKRQITKEVWTPEHDDTHDKCELSRAAITYTQYAGRAAGGFNATPMWPWDITWWKPSRDPIRNLVKAGALIAAEIDRLQRKAEKEINAK